MRSMFASSLISTTSLALAASLSNDSGIFRVCAGAASASSMNNGAANLIMVPSPVDVAAAGPASIVLLLLLLRLRIEIHFRYAELALQRAQVLGGDGAGDGHDRQFLGFGGHDRHAGRLAVLRVKADLRILAVLFAAHVHYAGPAGAAQLDPQQFDVGVGVFALVREVVAAHEHAFSSADDLLGRLVIRVLVGEELARHAEHVRVEGGVRPLLGLVGR